jgi:hypothetical protein
MIMLYVYMLVGLAVAIGFGWCIGGVTPTQEHDIWIGRFF